MQATVVTEKLALTAPAATVTAAGMLATAGALLASDTVAPPGGAGTLSVTVPVDALPAETLAGSTLKDASEAGTTLRIVERFSPP